jgi:predicted secreted hydrolase
MHSVELMLLDGDKRKIYESSYTAPEDEKNYSSADKMFVKSEFGTFKDDMGVFKAQMSSEHGSMDIVMTKRGELYNGTTGLLNFFMNSYQFSFPNMMIHGKFVIEGETYEVQNSLGWFDRQWTTGNEPNKYFAPETFEDFKASWLWIGMTLGEEGEEALSLWDAYLDKGRNAFATVMRKDGTQMNVVIDVQYHDTWKSEVTGGEYPNTFTVNIPAIDLTMSLVSLIDKPEFTHETDGIYGCESLCAVVGRYKGKEFKENVIVEMVGNLCGE